MRGNPRSTPAPDRPGGLSPRMRGNRRVEIVGAESIGSIPAHAGEPTWGGFSSANGQVYPRACGGTATAGFMLFRTWGLSPRMRGNLVGFVFVLIGTRSIPAHAGEPVTGERIFSGRGVYPRACGGTVLEYPIRFAHTGLSPRMRGNLRRDYLVHRNPGSIPAHAGEPGITTSPRLSKTVYPRACGGTDS